MGWPQRRLNSKQVGAKYGFRSGLEEEVAQDLTSKGVRFEFEKLTLQYEQPSKKRKYTPDFVLNDQKIIVETKGRFLTADRQKMILVKQQHPHLDIRILFSNAHQRISKSSKTTYAMWAEKNGFPWAHRKIPEEWCVLPN